MKYVLSLVLIFFSVLVFAQKLHTISLSEEQFRLDDQQFQIVQLIDGREDKTTIGWVQTGMLNSQRWAVFERPFEMELAAFLQNNLDTSGMHQPVLVRVNQLYISEQTKATTETAKAEVSLDFFLAEADGHYYYISSTYGTAEVKGMDVTRKHPANLARAFANALQRFSENGGPAVVDRNEHFWLDEIKRGETIEIDYSQIAIFNTPAPQDGIYVSFEDFRDHRPTITENYIIKAGNKTKAWMVDQHTGRKERIREDVYAIVQDNQPYILFHRAFYPLKKDEHGFFFTGPHIPDQAAVTTGAVLGGAIGGAIAASASGGKKEYAVDLSNGSIYEIGDSPKY